VLGVSLGRLDDLRGRGWELLEGMCAMLAPNTSCLAGRGAKDESSFRFIGPSECIARPDIPAHTFFLDLEMKTPHVAIRLQARFFYR
jgi:hypothetical protein